MVQGWVIAPLEDDCLMLEEMGFDIKKTTTIHHMGFECYAFFVEGPAVSMNRLKRFVGRLFWDIYDIGGMNGNRSLHTTEANNREHHKRGSHNQSTFF